MFVYCVCWMVGYAIELRNSSCNVGSASYATRSGALDYLDNVLDVSGVLCDGEEMVVHCGVTYWQCQTRCTSGERK